MLRPTPHPSLRAPAFRGPDRRRPRAAVLLLAALATLGFWAGIGSPAAAHHGTHVVNDTDVRHVHGRRVGLQSHGDPIAQFKKPRRLEPAPFSLADAETASGASEAFAAPASAALADTWCGTNTGRDHTPGALGNEPQIKVIYAYPSDQADRFSTYSSLIQTDVKAVIDAVAEDSANTKSLRFDLGTSCGPQYVDIMTVRLPNPRSYYTADPSLQFSRTTADVRAAVGDLGGKRNFAVYADYLSHPAAGTGQSYLSDSPGADSPHNDGGLFAVLWGRGGTDFFAGAASSRKVLLHEIGHTLGAVQDSAPHSTGAGHCTDERDVMCYADGGPNNAMTYPCPAGGAVGEPFDCSKDDYFSPAPAPGSYLATHWNTYNSVFTCLVAECTAASAPPPAPAAPPTAHLQASPSTAPSGTQVTLDASGSSDDRTIVRYQWDVNGDGTFERDTGRAATTTASYSRAGSYPVAVRVTDDDGLSSGDSATVTVTNRLPAASFDASSDSPQSGQSVTFSSRSSDPDGSVVREAWDLDGDGTYNDAYGSTAGRRFERPGSFTVGLRITDDQGDSAVERRTITVRNQAPTSAFSASPDSPQSGERVSFAASATDPDGSIAAFAWDLDGDGTFNDASGATASRSFASPGAYSVTLRVTDDGGASSTQTRTITVRNRPPVASFVVSAAPRTGRTVTFASTSSDPEGALAGVSWDLNGDGRFTDSTATQATRRFERPGRYPVRLRVTDRHGASAERSLVVEVRDGIPPAVRALPLSGQRLGAVVRGGLRLSTSCSEACRLRVTLLLEPRTARSLGIPAGRSPVVVGGALRTFRAAGSARTVALLSRTARPRLGRARGVRLVVRATASDREGNSRTASRMVTLVR